MPGRRCVHEDVAGNVDPLGRRTAGPGHHLFGAGEEAALRRVWFDKQRLGWTADRYSQTRVWKNTKEWTEGTVPALFRCGPGKRSDCLE